jgi:hypothetical protein
MIASALSVRLSPFFWQEDEGLCAICSQFIDYWWIIIKLMYIYRRSQSSRKMVYALVSHSPVLCLDLNDYIATAGDMLCMSSLSIIPTYIKHPAKQDLKSALNVWKTLHELDTIFTAANIYKITRSAMEYGTTKCSSMLWCFVAVSFIVIFLNFKPLMFSQPIFFT